MIEQMSKPYDLVLGRNRSFKSACQQGRPDFHVHGS
jgi:hypothetical protein